MIEGLIAGRLHGRAESRTSKAGRPFVVAKVRAAAEDAEAVFVSVIAFSGSAQDALLALADGDAVVLAGQATPRAWIDREGQARPGLDLVAQQVMTAYHAKRKRAAMQPAQDTASRHEGEAGHDQP